MGKTSAVFVGLFVWLSVAVLAQAPLTIGPNDALGFDYPDADLSTYGVLQFEVSYSGSPWTSLGIPPSIIDALTPPGSKTYKAVPPYTSGSYTAQFRACNAVGCGVASAVLPFAFGSVPTAPTQLRRVPR